jgi:BMFP domain-containing protein YqiC
MKKTNLLDDLAARLSDALPKNLQSIKKDVEKNFHAILMSTFAKLELVTREEFDTQSKVLARTRKKLDSLEKEIDELEKMLKDTGRKK